MYILGISAFYHDSSACLIQDGKVIVGVSEERLSRIKHDNSFPHKAISACLTHANIEINDIECIVFYEKPLQKFDRILNTFLQTAPKGYKNFITGMPNWIKTRLWTKNYIGKQLNYNGTIMFTTHHESHAASAFYTSPFKDAAILTVDGVGEWSTTTLGTGSGNSVTITNEQHFPHSLGLLYSAFTAYLGFEINEGEYKLMGMAGYGSPKYYNTIMDNLITINKDKSFTLNMDYFSFLHSNQMFNKKFDNLFNAHRTPEMETTQKHHDIAASIQKVTEDIILSLLTKLYSITDTKNLCMAGGVALNGLANKRIIEESDFEHLFIQPEAGDGGGSLGCAKLISHSVYNQPRPIYNKLKDVYIGPKYSSNDIKNAIENRNISNYEHYQCKTELINFITDNLVKGKVIGLYQGRMEWGQRALGNRSILANPTILDMKRIVNKMIKFREGFRPFAPVVLQEHWKEYFTINGQDDEYPYMCVVTDVIENKKETIPAVTHVDGTARIQTIKYIDNPYYYQIINSFYLKTGVPILLNTSFNLRGEPIVCTPTDALNTFFKSGMDYVVLENFLVGK